jgi:hypothetical protein
VDALDLDGVRPGDLAEPRELLRVRTRAATDDDHHVDLGRGLHGVLLTADRDRTDRVDDLELVGARDHERSKPLELPGRLGRLRQERHPLLARDGGVPFLLLVDDDRIGREAEQPDDLRVLGRSQDDDRVALVQEPHQLLLLLDHPGAGAIDDFETTGFGTRHDIRPNAVCPDDDRGTVVDVIERFDRLDAEVLEIADDPLVVDDLPEGMRRLAGGRGLLGLVDRLAHSVTKAGPLRDADLPGPFPYKGIIPRASVPTPSTSLEPCHIARVAVPGPVRRCAA